MRPTDGDGPWRGIASGILVGVAVAGVVRRRLELRRTRRGTLAPLGPATQTLPAPTESGLARRLSTWQPDVPRTDVGRVITAAWAAPLTVVGALLTASGGGRLTWDPQRACWVGTGIGGPSGALLAAVGMAANTMGHVVVCRCDAPGEQLLDHEAVHVRQAERLGPLLVPLYVLLSARHGYRENPLERAARRGAAAAR